MTKIEKRQLFFWMTLVCLLCALPFASHDLAAGDDALFHILRIEGLAQALKSGAGWPQRVYALLCGGYGYASGLFYPDVFLLPAALLRAFVLGPEMAFKFEMLFCVLLTALFAYAAGRQVLHSHTAGLLVMVLYSLCQYHFTNLYLRSAVGEVQAMAFLPLVVWGLYNLTEESMSKPWVLCAGFTGLLLSHTISLALAGLFAVGWVLCRLPRVLHRDTLLRLGAAAGVCLALGCWYWAPMLEQFGTDTFRVSVQPLTCLALNTVKGSDFFSLKGSASPGFGGFALLGGSLFLLALPLRHGAATALAEWKKDRFALALLAAGAAMSLLPLLPPAFWAKVDKTFLTSVQFPWRLNMLSQLCVAFAFAALAKNVQTAGALRLPRARIMVVALAFLLSAVNFAVLWPRLPELVNYPDNYFTSQRGETFYLVGQEWVPAGTDVTQFAFEPAAQYTDAAGAHTGVYTPDGAFQFEFTGSGGLYGIPKLYYKGYSAVLAPAQSGAEIALALHKDGAGRVELKIPDGLPAGTVTVRYAGTAVQHGADTVSLAAVVLLAAAAAARAIRKNRGKRKGRSA
jgi:hypothetical protein